MLRASFPSASSQLLASAGRGCCTEISYRSLVGGTSRGRPPRSGLTALPAGDREATGALGAHPPQELLPGELPGDVSRAKRALPHAGRDPECCQPFARLCPSPTAFGHPCPGSRPPGIWVRGSWGFSHLLIASCREIKQWEIRQSFCCLGKLHTPLAAASAAWPHGDWDKKVAGAKGFCPSWRHFHSFSSNANGFIFLL